MFWYGLLGSLFALGLVQYGLHLLREPVARLAGLYQGNVSITSMSVGESGFEIFHGGVEHAAGGGQAAVARQGVAEIDVGLKAVRPELEHVRILAGRIFETFRSITIVSHTGSRR